MKIPSDASRELIRVLLADSNQTQSEVMSSALRRHPGFWVTCCRAEMSECLRALESDPAQIVLLGNGANDHRELLGMVRGLHTAYPGIGIILLLDGYDRDLVVDAMRCGARGLFSLARQSFKSLCRCISCVHQGQIWANTEQLKYVIDALSVNPSMHVVDAKGNGLLTPREEEVVALVAEGIGNREIADKLEIKENTVKKALLRIYDKLGVSNRVELVLYALTHRENTKQCGAGRSSPARGESWQQLDKNAVETPAASSLAKASSEGSSGSPSCREVALAEKPSSLLLISQAPR